MNHLINKISDLTVNYLPYKPYKPLNQDIEPSVVYAMLKTQREQHSPSIIKSKRHHLP